MLFRFSHKNTITELVNDIDLLVKAAEAKLTPSRRGMRIWTSITVIYL